MRKSIRYIIAAAAAMFTAAVASAQVVNKKTATDNGNGTYTLTLESFATGSMGQTISTSRRPINAVLVLDVSGSMNRGFSNFKPFASAEYNYWKIYAANEDNSPYYFLHTDGKYYAVLCDASGIYPRDYYLYYKVSGTT